jgi:2-keto-4-pentenoate hydratase/2-oxohepta-3-ene-1,7-dioic acid hydratase in catechol pathway
MVFYRFHDPYQNDLSVGKIICLVRSYRKHAEEMGAEQTSLPQLFLKPASAVIFSGDHIVTPPQVQSLHHEVEVGVVIGKKGKNISKTHALDHVLGYVIGLDITARDIQSDAKKHGWPWGIAKGFDTFAPISDVLLKERLPQPNDIEFSLTINGEIRQKGNTKQLLWSIEHIISYISEIMTLEAGDLILTGTPEGIGELKKGDVLDAFLSDICSITVTVS